MVSTSKFNAVSPCDSPSTGGQARPSLMGRRAFVLALTLSALLPLSVLGQVSPVLQKYVDPLPKPGVYTPVSTSGGVHRYVVDMYQVQQKLHRDLPPTTVWTYNGTYPGRSFDVSQGQTIEVRWNNILPPNHIFAIDKTLPDTSAPGLPDVRAVVHRHGGLQDGQDDGHPDAWFTPFQATNGVAFAAMHGHQLEIDASYATNVFTYENDQDAATLWYHDHAAGITRLNVYAGLAGFYLLRDAVENSLNLPKGDYEIPLAIQDRTFRTNGQLYYPSRWEKDFHGDTAVVNGVVWPYKQVDRRKYRFRILNGSNTRQYNLKFSNGLSFNVIGTDSGLLAKPVRTGSITLQPGERIDVVVDFRSVDPNNPNIQLLNSERGDGPDLGEIMQFRVRPGTVTDNSSLPSTLRSLPATPLSSAVKTRLVSLEHDATGTKAVLLDGKFRHEPTTEIAKAGTVESWNIVNFLGETHPIHLHMGDFQILNRQPIDGERLHRDLMKWRDGMGPEPVLANYLKGSPVAPKSYEKGNKDTVQAKEAHVTRILMKFGEYVGESVWHCHVLEHEDNDMMRPLRVEP